MQNYDFAFGSKANEPESVKARKKESEKWWK